MLHTEKYKTVEPQKRDLSAFVHAVEQTPDPTRESGIQSKLNAIITERYAPKPGTDRKEFMKEQRKRNQSITVRLTAEEKKIMLRLAAKEKLSLTDYILASALGRESSLHETARTVLERLSVIEKVLRTVKAENTETVLSDIQEAQTEIRAEIYTLLKGA